MKHSPIYGGARWPADYAERVEAACLAVDFADAMTAVFYGRRLVAGNQFIMPELVPLVDSAEDVLSRCEQHGLDEC